VRPVSLFFMLLTSAVVFAPNSARAARKLNDADPFVCVPTTVWECGSEGDCERGTAQSENLPQFFTIDINAKTLGAGEKGRQSTIERVTRSGATTVLSGADGSRSWVVNVNLQTGSLSAGVTGDNESFVIYGVCLPQ